jgi:hypothetical protein
MPARRHRRAASPRGVHVTFGVLLTGCVAAHWFAAPRSTFASLAGRDPSGLPPPAAPAMIVRLSPSSSRGLRSPPGSVPDRAPPAARATDRPSPGVSLPSALPVKWVRFPRAFLTRHLPPSEFPLPGRLAPHLASHPSFRVVRSWDSPFRAFHLSSSHDRFRDRVPPWRFTKPTAPS